MALAMELVVHDSSAPGAPRETSATSSSQGDEVPTASEPEAEEEADGWEIVTPKRTQSSLIRLQMLRCLYRLGIYP